MPRPPQYVRRLALPALAIALATLASAPRAAAQPAPPPASSSTGTIVGVVTDGATGAPMPLAELLVDGAAIGARTDSAGRYRVAGLARGAHTLVVRRIGYVGDSVDVDVDADTVVIGFALLAAPVRLATTTITEARTVFGPMEFESRLRARGGGWFVTGDQLAANTDRKLGDVIGARIPSIRILRHPDGSQYAASRRSPLRQRAGRADPCIVRVFVDGIQLGDGASALTEFIPNDLAGVEYHDVTTAPVQYRKPGTECGVLLLWTRRR
jgi:hypothetical protein